MAIQLLIRRQMGYRLRALAGKKNQSTKPHEASRSGAKMKKSAVNDITWVPSSDFVDD
jgi:membrane protein required for beta-lactamase induction